MEEEMQPQLEQRQPQEEEEDDEEEEQRRRQHIVVEHEKLESAVSAIVSRLSDFPLTAHDPTTDIHNNAAQKYPPPAFSFFTYDIFDQNGFVKSISRTWETISKQRHDKSRVKEEEEASTSRKQSSKHGEISIGIQDWTMFVMPK